MRSRVASAKARKDFKVADTGVLKHSSAGNATSESFLEGVLKGLKSRFGRVVTRLLRIG
jgi:hypothetical protein